MLILFKVQPALALQNLSGSLRMLGGRSLVDTTEVKSLDQQYTLSYSRTLLPYLQTRFSLNFHQLQTYPEFTTNTWHGELGPSGDLAWTNPLFVTGANYRYWEVRDRSASNNSLSRGAGAYFRTRFISLPQSNLQFNWNRNTSLSGFTPLDNEEKRWQYSANYAFKRANFYYSFSNRDFSNLNADVGENLKQHVFRLDYGDNYFKNKLRVSADYLFTSTRRQENNGSNAQLLTQILPVLGLYAQDDLPETGALDTLTTLVDNNLTDPSSPEINIGGAFIDQNIGFDLGIPRTINSIYVCTDRQSDPTIQWTVYSSDDNFNWSLLPNDTISTFNPAFQRYEIPVAAPQARYFKVINSGVNEQPEVFVTEVQVFMNSASEAALPDKSENHRVNANASYQFRSNLQTSIDAVYGTILENNTGLQRSDANLTGSVSYKPIPELASLARYQHSVTDYSSNLVATQKTDLYSLNFLANPLKTLELSLSGAHAEIYENNIQNQRTNSGLFHVSAQLYPSLSAQTEVSFSRNERPSLNSSLDTWSYRVSADANLYQNFNVIANYLAQFFSTAQTNSTGRRDEVDIRFNYRITPSIFLRGDGTYTRETDRVSFLHDYSLSWNLTSKIAATTEIRFQDVRHYYHSRSLSLQTNYYFSNRTNAFISYSSNKVSNSIQQKTSSYQVGINTSF